MTETKSSVFNTSKQIYHSLFLLFLKRTHTFTPANVKPRTLYSPLKFELAFEKWFYNLNFPFCAIAL